MKKRGRGIALSRALSAMTTKENSDAISNYVNIPDPVINFLQANKIHFKSEYDPTLTEYEKAKMTKPAVK